MACNKIVLASVALFLFIALSVAAQDTPAQGEQKVAGTQKGKGESQGSTQAPTGGNEGSGNTGRAVDDNGNQDPKPTSKPDHRCDCKGPGNFQNQSAVQTIVNQLVGLAIQVIPNELLGKIFKKFSIAQIECVLTELKKASSSELEKALKKYSLELKQVINNLYKNELLQKILGGKLANQIKNLNQDQQPKAIASLTPYQQAKLIKSDPEEFLALVIKALEPYIVGFHVLDNVEAILKALNLEAIIAFLKAILGPILNI